MSECKNCAWSHVMKPDILSGQRNEVRVCRRFPPQVSSILVPTGGGQAAMANNTAWPAVQDTDACGEFKPRMAGLTSLK